MRGLSKARSLDQGQGNSLIEMEAGEASDLVALQRGGHGRYIRVHGTAEST